MVASPLGRRAATIFCQKRYVMLISADDYPLHQTPDPMAFAGSDRNFYDRFFFNGYSPDAAVFFAAALGVYPQLNIMDASFCLSIDGRQYNLRASKEMNGDRLDLRVGPLQVEIVEPMRETHLTIGDNEYGLSGTLTALARHRAIEEPRFTRRQGTRLFMDYTRATQNITWCGTLTLNGETINVDACQGTRDRSWGLRPIGTHDPQPSVPLAAPQFYWLWTPTNFAEYCFFSHTNDDGAGAAWNRRAILQDLASNTQSEFEHLDMAVDYRAGTRRIANLTVSAQNTLDTLEARFTPLSRIFYMQGLGYTHPEWGHGCHHGAEKLAFDTLDLDAAEATLGKGGVQNLHIQSLARVELEGPVGHGKGMGVIEQLLIGPHAPSGFEDLLDPVIT